MSVATTRGFKVEVESEYVPERSDPDRNVYFFVYHVTLTNEGDEAMQLISRHWIITNAEGKTEEVQGPGVVGEQPNLEPGESFEYSSFCHVLKYSFNLTDNLRSSHPRATVLPVIQIRTVGFSLSLRYRDFLRLRLWSEPSAFGRCFSSNWPRI